MDAIRDFVVSVASKLEEFKASLKSSKDDINQLKDANTSINIGLEAIKGDLKSFNEQKTLLSMALGSFDTLSEKIANFLRDSKAEINETMTLATKRLDDAISAIPTPKDGEDGKDAVVDYVKIDETITAKSKEHKKELSKQLEKKIDDKFAKIEVPQAEKVDYNVVDFKVRAAMSQIPKSETTVKDVSLKKKALVIDYTDGKSKSIALPTGGGGTAVYQTGGGGTETYTNLTPTAVSIGGIPAGSTFDNMTMQEMWDALLYPYQTPIFSSFTSSMSTPIEVGSTIPAGSVTFLWNTTNSSNIAANSIKIDDITAGNTLASGLANTGTTAISISEITNVMATSHQWKITATNTKGAFLSRTLNVYWQWKIYYGESALTDLIEADVEALRVGTLAANVSGNYSFNAGEYKWICYPTSFGLKTTFKDASTNFDVAMQPALTKSITNSQGVSTNYYCHRTVNKLGGSITIAIS